jgi:glycosyltransferase involved in cell wall biosynthesis
MFKGVRIAIVAEGSLMSQPEATAGARFAGLFVAIYCPLVDRFTQTGHLDGEEAEIRFMLRYSNFPNCWITLTAFQADEFRNWSRTVRPILTLPNTFRREFPIVRGQRSGCKKNILVLGRLARFHKGLDYVIDFVRSQAGALRDRNWVVQLVGDGIDAKALRAEISASGIQDIIEMQGWSIPEEAISQADCLLLPSRFEGVPLVVLEAISAGLPLVCSDLPGTRTFVHPDCLFEVGDMHDAFAKIERLLSDQEFQDRMREWNEDRLTQYASAEGFTDAVRQISAFLDSASRK